MMTWKWRSFHCLRKILSSAVTRDDDVGAGSGKKEIKCLWIKFWSELIWQGGENFEIIQTNQTLKVYSEE